MTDLTSYFASDPNERLADLPTEEDNFDMDPETQLTEEFADLGVDVTVIDDEDEDW